MVIITEKNIVILLFNFRLLKIYKVAIFICVLSFEYIPIPLYCIDFVFSLFLWLHILLKRTEINKLRKDPCIAITLGFYIKFVLFIFNQWNMHDAVFHNYTHSFQNNLDVKTIDSRSSFNVQFPEVESRVWFRYNGKKGRKWDEELGLRGSVLWGKSLKANGREHMEHIWCLRIDFL